MVVKKAKSPFPLRAPDELMDIIKRKSAESERSVNAEIIFQLKKLYREAA
jgi:hypothetical protein